MKPGVFTYNDFVLTISLPPYGNDKTEYFDVNLNEIKNNFTYYIDLRTDPRIPVDFKFPPKPIKVKKKKSKSDIEEDDVEIIPDTPEEAVYREEYKHYEFNKSMQMPLWRLHFTTIEKIIEAIK